MAQPNRFLRNNSFLVTSFYNPDEDTNERGLSFANGEWFIKEIDRFVDANENLNATIRISNKIDEVVFRALDIWFDVDSAPTQSTNLDEVLDFFLLP